MGKTGACGNCGRAADLASCGRGDASISWRSMPRPRGRPMSKARAGGSEMRNCNRLTVVVLLALGSPQFAAALELPDWSAWKHRKSVEITGKDWKADQVDYPIRIVCHRGKGKYSG